MKRLLQLVLTFNLCLFTFGAAVPAAAQALSAPPISGNEFRVAADSNADACAGLAQVADGTNCAGPGAQSNPGQDRIAGIAKAAVNVISLIAGIAAVIMIMVAGVKFVTSGGDSNAVGGAKNALTYAIVGLVVVVLAQVIVHFVLNAVINNAVTPN